jgi:hypothetical protein
MPNENFPGLASRVVRISVDSRQGILKGGRGFLKRYTVLWPDPTRRSGRP